MKFKESDALVSICFNTFSDALFCEYNIRGDYSQKILADFDKIPQPYHQMFLQMLQIRYGGIVNIWDNTQPFTPPEKQKKKWYQIWK